MSTINMDTINNTLPVDDEFSGLALSEKMPNTVMSDAYKKNISPILKGVGFLFGMWGLAYAGNKIKDQYQDTLMQKAKEANDIRWDI